MITRATSLLVAALLAAESTAADNLSVTTSAASATVRPAANGQIRMPALEIEARILGTCGEGSEPVSLSLSSADSVQFVGLESVGADGAWQTVFSLPASQVPPLVARGFCTADAPSGQSTSIQPTAIRKEAFLSLRVNFRCSDGETERLTTQTELVDVDLVCEADAADQDSSE